MAMNVFNKDGYSMRNESSSLSKVPHSAVQNTLHQLPFFLLILAKWSGTEQVTQMKLFLGFVAVAAVQPRLSLAAACRNQVSRNHNSISLTLRKKK